MKSVIAAFSVFLSLACWSLSAQPGKRTKTAAIDPPATVTETTRNDTVFQESVMQKRATPERAFLEVTILDYDHQPLNGERVFMDVAGSPTVFTAKTNNRGKAFFLLPYSRDYTLNLAYERDIFLCKYPLREGILIEDEALVTYRGTDRIRDFFGKARRDKNGFITEFMTMNVRPIGFDPANVEKTKNGYHVNYPAKSETPTPAILGDNDVIQGGGYYSKEVYSFNNKTGRFNWGLELCDNGVSASVCDENYLVITTESCTLYAIDARTGKLAWSKWLGPEINSTPTIANGNVYAVYPTELEAGTDGKKPYAVICFKLETGAILWQNWIDAEPLGSPVATSQSLFITTSEGNLHQFDIATGKGQAPLPNGGFTSPPTIAGGIVYVARGSREYPGSTQIAAFRAGTFTPCGLFPLVAGTGEASLSPSERMNFSSSRPLFFRGRLYAVSGNELACFDPGKFAVAWTLDLSRTRMSDDAFTSMPAAVNNMIIASTKAGNVLVIDPVKGAVETVYNLGAAVKFQPVIHDGWIYAGSKDGRLISYNTGNRLLTGWPMWSMNAAHNPAVE